MKTNTKHQSYRTFIRRMQALQNLEKTNDSQIHTDYTPQVIQNSSSTNSIYQNTTNQLQLTKEKIWTVPLFLENPKNKDFQSPDLEIDFSIHSGAESNTMNIPI